MCHSSLRSICRLAVGVFLVALVMHTWLLMGLVVPVTVAGSSMAPTLNGPHLEYRCDGCQQLFSVGLDQTSAEMAAECPSCGRLSEKVVSHALTGDRLLVDRMAFAFRSPRRWEVVVFRSPTDESELCVKRIVGLPGETVALASGELRIDGKPVAVPHELQYGLRYGDHDRLSEGWRLGPEEYFVLGDNAEISDDSRNWPGGPALDAELLVGRPLGVR
jgi:signal peptidase I